MEFNFRQLGETLSDIEEQLGVKAEIVNEELHIKLNKWELEDDIMTENEIKCEIATNMIDELRELGDYDFDYIITDDGFQISIV